MTSICQIIIKTNLHIQQHAYNWSESWVSTIFSGLNLNIQYIKCNDKIYIKNLKLPHKFLCDFLNEENRNNDMLKNILKSTPVLKDSLLEVSN